MLRAGTLGDVVGEDSEESRWRMSSSSERSTGDSDSSWIAATGTRSLARVRFGGRKRFAAAMFMVLSNDDKGSGR